MERKCCSCDETNELRARRQLDSGRTVGPGRSEFPESALNYIAWQIRPDFGAVDASSVNERFALFVDEG